ncbi:hypothetical protein [Methylobacterium soli]|uniref:Uncharacterized protein n=1 Tax=Methylobacterium soli TaxID=553447 RepID=A0A6L3SVG3_9HYPH|nr:hypothetical protein [Methylobacterium soli]KAB1075427.1 hypothetical protein F6X53_25010 [Methylobacterium soli]GJE41325.1 hypothetical protein AEGHOMDF_0489 [Methylobacterium soli]
MTRETINVVMPVIRSKKGKLEPGTALMFKSADEAKRRAERVAQNGPGAIAFSRSGDPDLGEYDEPVVLGTYGTVPPAVMAVVAPMPF